MGVGGGGIWDLFKKLRRHYPGWTEENRDKVYHTTLNPSYILRVREIKVHSKQPKTNKTFYTLTLRFLHGRRNNIYYYFYHYYYYYYYYCCCY